MTHADKIKVFVISLLDIILLTASIKSALEKLAFDVLLIFFHAGWTANKIVSKMETIRWSIFYTRAIRWEIIRMSGHIKWSFATALTGEKKQVGFQFNRLKWSIESFISKLLWFLDIHNLNNWKKLVKQEWKLNSLCEYKYYC